jgi:hypothetical protein
MEVSGQLHGPAAFPPANSPLYSLDKRLGGPQRQYECNGKEKELLMKNMKEDHETIIFPE